MNKSAKTKGGGKKRKVNLNKKLVISQELSAFIPEVSRMGGSNPADWRWGMNPEELRPERLAKKAT